MKEEYNRLFDKIASERSDNELLEAAVRKAERMNKTKRLNRKAVAVPIAAAAVLVAVGTGAGAAFGGFDALSELFGANNALVSEIRNEVFADSDSHVNITVQQLISDGRSIRAAVRYEALDDIGREWLATAGFGSDDIRLCTSDGNSYVSRYGAHELTEYRTETERYCSVNYLVADYGWNKNLQFDIVYSLPTKENCSAPIDVQATIDSRRYRISGENRCSDYLTPTVLDISPLTYALYAHDDYGVEAFEEKDGISTHKTYITPEQYAEQIGGKEFVLVLSDGGRIHLFRERSGIRLYPDGDLYSDYLWGSDEIFDAGKPYNDFERSFTFAFSLDELVGIEIGGVHYDLIAE